MKTESPAAEETLEKQFSFPDPNKPEFWLSDGTWNGIRSQYQLAYDVCASMHFLLSMEPDIRKLAARYRRKPELFYGAFERAKKRQAKKLGIPYVENGVPESISVPDRLTLRQQKALSDAAPLIQQLFTGGPEAFRAMEPNPQLIRSFVDAFAIRKSGRKASDKFDEAYALYCQGEKDFATLAKTIDPRFLSQSFAQRTLTKNRIRSAIKRRRARERQP